MNTLKRILAFTVCLALVLTCFVGCHEKGEIAVKIGDVEFSSGYYACALVYADMEARSLVDEQLSEKDDSSDEIKYYKYKVENTDYTKWVENKVLKNLKELAALQILCAEADISLDAESISLSDTNSDYLWDNYGYSVLMEANGVSKETFKQYMRDTYFADAYFKHLYGKDGEKEVPADKITKQLSDNYILANTLEVSFSDLTDEKIKEKKDQFAAYEDSLKDGSKTFEEIYLEYNNISSEDHKHEDAKEGELTPLDPHATVLGNKETSYASQHFDTAKAMEINEIKLVTLEDNKGLALIVKKDILADPYYIDEFDTMLRQDIVGEEYNKEILEYGEKLECTINKSSVKQFKIKNLYYPEAAY